MRDEVNLVIETTYDQCQHIPDYKNTNADARSA